jgi:hypothetical protein
MSPATLTDTGSFIEAQFPVSRVSKESYKERKSNRSQTLTGLGKWWGRKARDSDRFRLENNQTPRRASHSGAYACRAPR